MVQMSKVSFQKIFITLQRLIVFDDRRIHAVDAKALVGKLENFRMAYVEVEECDGGVSSLWGLQLIQPSSGTCKLNLGDMKMCEVDMFKVRLTWISICEMLW